MTKPAQWVVLFSNPTKLPYRRLDYDLGTIPRHLCSPHLFGESSLPPLGPPIHTSLKPFAENIHPANLVLPPASGPGSLQQVVSAQICELVPLLQGEAHLLKFHCCLFTNFLFFSLKGLQHRHWSYMDADAAPKSLHLSPLSSLRDRGHTDEHMGHIYTCWDIAPGAFN